MSASFCSPIVPARALSTPARADSAICGRAWHTWQSRACMLAVSASDRSASKASSFPMGSSSGGGSRPAALADLSTDLADLLLVVAAPGPVLLVAVDGLLQAPRAEEAVVAGLLRVAAALQGGPLGVGLGAVLG